MAIASPDPWDWCGGAIERLVGMLEGLNELKVKCPPEAVAFLRAQHERLGIVIGDQSPKDVSHASPSRSPD